MSVTIICKKWDHYNRALGKYINTKRQYDNEMAKQGMVSFEKGKELAEKHKRDTHKPYDRPSEKAMALIRSFESQRPGHNKNGKIRLNPQQIQGMKELGVSFDPKFRPPEGGGGFK